MNKTQFTYQRWILRYVLSFGILFIVIYLEDSIIKLLNIELHGFINVTITVLSFYFYYKLTENLKFFKKQGFYWVDSGIVYLELNDKIYELKNIKFIDGTTISFYGWSKSGRLTVQIGKKRIILVSGSDEPKKVFEEPIKDFSESKLFPLFNTILQYNPELEKNDKLDFWYENQ